MSHLGTFSVSCCFVFRHLAEVFQAFYQQPCPKDPPLLSWNEWCTRSYYFLWWRDEGRSTQAHVFWSMRPLFHYQPPCHIQATAHKLATNAIQLYNNLRLTVHLRLLNLKKRKRTKIRPKDPKPNSPTNTRSVAILSISFLMFTWHNSSVKTQITPKLRNQLRVILIT